MFQMLGSLFYKNFRIISQLFANQITVSMEDEIAEYHGNGKNLIMSGETNT